MWPTKLFSLLAAMALALGLCSVPAFAVDGASDSAQPKLEPGSGQIDLATAAVDYNPRVVAGGDNVDPINSVTIGSNQPLVEGVDYRVEYCKADDYSNRAVRLGRAPTTPGRYVVFIRPASNKYTGMKAFFYQVIEPDHVERNVSEAQEADVTWAYDASGVTYYYAYQDPQTGWTHYTDSVIQKNEWNNQGYTTYQSNMNNKSVLYFAQDPNTGQYIFTDNRDTIDYRAYTMKGLTYHMNLCVAVNEAASLIGADQVVVSNEDGFDVNPKRLWVSKAAYMNLVQAIANAEAVGVSKYASKAKVNAATERLEDAVEVFRPEYGRHGMASSSKNS